MSVNLKLLIKFLNGELLEIYYHPEDELDAIHKHILDCKPELHTYELILFHLNEEEKTETNRIHDVHQLLDESVIGIYVKKKPHVKILFVEPIDFYSINTIDFGGYSYRGTIQKYKAILYMGGDYDTRYRFIFYYDKYSKKFAYDKELHTLDGFERGRPRVEGYCKWPSIYHMLKNMNDSDIRLPSQFNITKILEYSILFDNEWNTELSYFANQC